MLSHWRDTDTTEGHASAQLAAVSHQFVSALGELLELPLGPEADKLGEAFLEHQSNMRRLPPGDLLEGTSSVKFDPSWDR